MRTRHLLAVIFLLAGAARAQELNVISSVEVKDDGSNVVVSVKGTKPPNFTTFSMADPPRFVIDLSESKFQGVAESVAVDDGVISVVKNLSYGTGATAIARVMVAFVADVEPPDVQTVGNDLVIRVAKPAGAATAVATTAAPDAGQAQAEAQARAQAEADARATAQVEAAALAASQQRAREEAEAARADAQAQAQVQAEAEAQAAAAAQAQAEPPAGEKLGDEGVVVAPAETPAEPSAEEARIAAAAAERQRAREDAAAAAAARAAAAAQARADAEAARAAEAQAKADAKARAAEDARARKQAEADARAAAAAEKKAAAEAAAAAKVAAAAEKKAAAEAARQAALDAKREAAAAKAAERSAALAAAGPSAKLAEIGFKQLPGASRVYVRTTVTPRFTVTDVGDDTVRVELENTRATRRNDTRFLDTSFFPSPVALITPSKKGSAYVVDIKLKQRVPYRQKVEGDVLAIDFERPQPAAGAPAEGAPAAEPADAGTVVAPDEGTVVAPAEPATDAPPKQ